MIGFPISKINLGLYITAKRPDGYHDIETVFYPVKLSDALEFVISEGPSNKDILTTTGIDTGSDPDDNLVIKTVNKLRERYSFPVLKIHLHKAIPVGAGLGGGSSDSVCLLKAINKGFGLNISNEELRWISMELGSDCPFFLNCAPALGKGRGEILTKVPPVLAGTYLVLVNPRVSINTREAYQNCTPKKPATSLSELINYPLTEWREHITNDFEKFAFKSYPVISEIKEELYRSGALFSLMSGSGSSVYGIFHHKPELSGMIKDFVIFKGYM